MKKIELDEGDMASRYLEGKLSVEEIGKVYGVSKRTALRCLHRQGIRSYRRYGPRSIYHYDEHFFDEINTEEKAYWLGMLAADGCVLERSGKRKGASVVLSLQWSDAEHVYAFASALQATNPVRKTTTVSYQKETFVATLEVYGYVMPMALARHGITPRKTFTHAWPDLEGDLLRHYLRGYFDGDGHFRPLVAEVIGTDGFIANLRDHLESIGARRGSIRHPNSDPRMSVLWYGGNKQVSLIHRYLYEGATVQLSRKADALTVWSKRFVSCVECHRNDSPYVAKGLCSRCYQRHRRADHLR